MESTDLNYQKYPTRECGGQIDEGDFYQILQEREDDETLTDSTDRLLNAARTYIYQESAHVWRNAEVALLGPDDQLLFTSGTQANKFVVTFDDRDKVQVYCRERSWNSVRNGKKKPEKAGLSWRSLVSRFRGGTQTPPPGENNLQMDTIHPVQATRLNNQTHPLSKGVTTYEDNTDANEKYYNKDVNEKYYSADEFEIIPKHNGVLKNTPKRSTVAQKIVSVKNSIMKNNVISSASCVLVGVLHMIRLFIVVYWQLIKCVFKTIRNR